MKFIYLFLYLIVANSCATTKIVSVQPMEKIVQANGSKTELYVKANEWAARIFGSSKSVIQFQDKESGKVVGKYLLFSYENLQNLYWNQRVEAIITINTKDNAAKITIEPISKWDYYPRSALNYSPEKAKKDIDDLVNDFEKFMNLQTTTW